MGKIIQFIITWMVCLALWVFGGITNEYYHHQKHECSCEILKESPNE